MSFYTYHKDAITVWTKKLEKQRQAISEESQALNIMQRWAAELTSREQRVRWTERENVTLENKVRRQQTEINRMTKAMAWISDNPGRTYEDFIALAKVKRKLSRSRSK